MKKFFLTAVASYLALVATFSVLMAYQNRRAIKEVQEELLERRLVAKTKREMEAIEKCLDNAFLDVYDQWFYYCEEIGKASGERGLCEITDESVAEKLDVYHRELETECLNPDHYYRLEEG